jgi:hypothetical protein
MAQAKTDRVWARSRTPYACKAVLTATDCGVLELITDGRNEIVASRSWQKPWTVFN